MKTDHQQCILVKHVERSPILPSFAYINLVMHFQLQVPTHGNIRNYYIILAENMEEVRLDTGPSFIV
jgi:hypothetical protein